MGRRYKTVIWIVAGVIVTGVAVRLIRSYRAARKPVVLTGAVIRQDADPRKQAPIANARVTVVSDTQHENTRSDASGLFRLTLDASERGVPFTLRFDHADYQPLDVAIRAENLLYVVRMEPLVRETVKQPDHIEAAAPTAKIANIRVRYTVKNQTLISVGSVAKQFEVVNKGDVPCQGRRPCSPDGKWKAATGHLSLDADKRNEFRNVRASCIAGPCPFTRLDPNDLSRPSRNIDITALDWSDTASFLVEAEVTRTMITNMVRQSYPFVLGTSVSFALPFAAEGPSLIADINGQEIVFPLGPNLNLSWTTCSVEAAPGGNKLYRCEVKSGFQIQE